VAQQDPVPVELTSTEHTDSPADLTSKTKAIPPELDRLQRELVLAEQRTDSARTSRNKEIARLRDELKISQYRIAKWLGVTERAVMLMAKQGREESH